MLRIINDNPRPNEGECFRKLVAEHGTLEVSHYIQHTERRTTENGSTYYNVLPEFTDTLAIRKYQGVWWILWWAKPDHNPKWLPWNYVTAEEATEAMMTASDCIIAA